MKGSNKQLAHVLKNFPKVKPAQNPLAGVNRNGACPCGSGKKWKKCCLRDEQVSRQLAMAVQDGEQQGLRDELVRLERQEIERLQQEAEAIRKARADRKAKMAELETV